MIRVENVTKIYPVRDGSRIVLDNINFSLNKGEKIGILGRNGAGKSTLIRLLGGVELPTSGEIIRDMTLSWPLAFGGAFQGSLTGVDNIRFICRIYGVEYDRVYDFVESFAELGKYLQEPVKVYSSGMRARLAFALSLAIDFDCYLIDEVLSVGDANFHKKSHEELFVKRADKSMIIVSHELHNIKEFCSKAALLNKGKLQVYEDLDEAMAIYNGL